MIVTTFSLGLIGLGLTFASQEFLIYFSVKDNAIITALIQLLGALYLGFSIMNWMAKDALFGGIYNKPLVIGNFMHFGSGALALIKMAIRTENVPESIIATTFIYSILALSFAYLFFNNPKSVSKN